MQRSILPLLTLFFVACSGTEKGVASHSFRVFTENGVTISESSGGPKYTEPIFEFVEIFDLEQDESRPEMLLNRATTFMMDEEGLIYAFDSGDGRVAVFARDGTYLRDFGRQGSGPGEFSFIRASWMKDGLIGLYDPLQYRASIFTTEGQYIESFTRAGTSNRMRLAPIMRYLNAIIPLPDGRIVHLLHEDHNYSTREQTFCSVAVLYSADGDSLRSFSTDELPLPAYPSKRGGVINERTMFTGSPSVQIHVGRGILMADPREPMVRWYDFDGTLKRVHRLGLNPIPVSTEERNAIQEFYRDRILNAEGDTKDHLEESWQYTVIPDQKGLWESVLVDDQGFHWLRYHTNWLLPEEERGLWSYMVFSPEGEYLGSVTWPGHICSISRGHYLWRNIDEETGGYRYVVYDTRPTVEGLEYPIGP